MVIHQIPKTLYETLKLLDTNQYQVICGGTDIMVQARSIANTLPKVSKPLIFINQLQELNFIEETNDFILIGSTTTYEQLLNSSIIPKILKDTIIEIAAPGIRHVGTLAGNIANASPAADAVCTLIALDAFVELISLNTSRYEKVSDFITGVKKTTLKPNEIIRSIKIPNMEHDHASFYKVGGRKADAISKVSFCGLCNVRDNVITKFRIAFGAVGQKVVTNIQIDESFVGKSVDEMKNSLETVKTLYTPYITPIDDQRSTKVYRNKVALNLLNQFIESL